MKKIVWISLIVIAILFSGTLLLLRELTYVQMPDLDRAAQVALDNSALNQIETAKPYTGGPFCYVFQGNDKLGRAMIAFATKDGVLGQEFLEKGFSEEKIREKAQASGFTNITTVTPGIVDNTSNKNTFTNKPTGNFIWEVYGTNIQGQKQLTYYDLYSGNMLVTYSLKTK